MSSPLSGGWPIWQRVNMVFLTLVGGAVGFYWQDKLLQEHKLHLTNSLPQLEQSLQEVKRRRASLEEQLRKEEREHAERV